MAKLNIKLALGLLLQKKLLFNNKVMLLQASDSCFKVRIVNFRSRKQINTGTFTNK